MQTVAASTNDCYRDSYVRFGSFMASDSSGHSQQDTVRTLHAHPNWVRTPATTTRWIEIDGPMCYLNAGCIRNYKQRSTPTESKQSVVSSIGTHTTGDRMCARSNWMLGATEAPIHSIDACVCLCLLKCQIEFRLFRSAIRLTWLCAMRFEAFFHR